MAPLFGSLCQVSKIQQRLSILLANAYDGSGMRAIKTTGAGTTYFLDDAAGQPVVEETYTGSPTPTTTLSVVSAFGPAGLRSRYTVPTGSETQFFFDPQGTVVNRIASVDSGVAVKGEPFTDVSVWDGYGQERSDQWTNITVDNQYTPSDPVGFEGEAGYYQDWELAKTSNPASYVYLRSVPSLLTHRYYDASTGRFVNRDPIGYQGGTNLYGYAGGNPVNEQDPSGNNPVGDFARGSLHQLNPVTWFKGSYAFGQTVGRLILGQVTPKQVGTAVVQGLQFWNAPNAYVAGERFTNDALIVGGVGLAKRLSAVGAVGAEASSTGTVWEHITPTQENYPGTVLPRSFEMTTETGGKFWVHGNATEHMAEEIAYANANGSNGAVLDMVAQARLSSLRAAISEVENGGVVYGQRYVVGGWQLTFSAPRIAGQLPVVFHARPVP